MACLVLSAPANDAIDAVECSRRYKQDVGGVDWDGVTASTARAAVWNVDYGTFKQFQHALPHSAQWTVQNI